MSQILYFSSPQWRFILRVAFVLFLFLEFYLSPKFVGFLRLTYVVQIPLYLVNDL